MKIIKLFALLFFIGYAQAQDDDILHMSFEKALSDEQIIEFINKQSTRPTAFFLWAEGHSYSYRIYRKSQDHLTTKEIVSNLREEYFDDRESEKNHDISTARSILSSFTKEEFLLDNENQSEASFIISIINQKKKAIKYFADGKPIIYGLEFVATTEALKTIRDQEEVKIGHIKSIDLDYGEKYNAGLNPNPPPKSNLNGIKPEIYNHRTHADYYLDLTPSELWDKMKELAETGDIKI